MRRAEEELYLHRLLSFVSMTTCKYVLLLHNWSPDLIYNMFLIMAVVCFIAFSLVVLHPMLRTIGACADAPPATSPHRQNLNRHRGAIVEGSAN